MDPRSFIGKRLGDPAIPTPVAVLDRAVVQRNCGRMLASVQSMHIGWRAHVKTHKTIELTRLQVGEELPVRLIVSTVLEAERLLPLLRSYQDQKPKGRSVNVLYGFPLFATAVPRLAAVARALGPGTVSVLVDHPDQVAVVQQLAREAATAILVFVKIDMGSSRAGVVPGSPQFASVVHALLAAHDVDGGNVTFYGLYCHAGHSYEARDPWAAMEHLVSEFTALGYAAEQAQRVVQKEEDFPRPSSQLRLVLSAGASPTAASLQHPRLIGSNRVAAPTDRTAVRVDTLISTMDGLEAQGYELEAHAGVQPVLDLQQLATHSWDWGRHASEGCSETDDLALTVLADVASVYPGRGAQKSDEVLINAGCLALGREPVKNVPIPDRSGSAPSPTYAGWGIVQPWPTAKEDGRIAVPGAEFPRLLPADGGKGWWQVGRISQEHGILTWAGGSAPPSSVTPEPGQRLRIWPNHACIAGAGFSSYLIVDSTSKDPDEVVDVWERWNGW